jgi:chromosomal replication initiator protein
MQTFENWVALPENRSAQVAVERVLEDLCTGSAPASPSPLFLHGPSGTGKTHLLSALVARAVLLRPGLTVTRWTANEYESLVRAEFATPASEPDERTERTAAAKADLVIVEDVQHLSAQVTEPFTRLIDRCLVRGRQLVWSGTVGPAELTHLPGRLTSRLASGLVVGLQPLSPVSRLVYLQERARRRQLNLAPDVLGWLSGHVSGSARQLEGALGRVEALARLSGTPLTVEQVAEQFQTEAEASRPTVERIAQRVGRYFQLEPQKLQGRGRERNALLPRQIGMYLARRLTGLSLQQIGAYFGGRDHTTVLHACRKVEQALTHDVALSGAVRQLHADLA